MWICQKCGKKDNEDNFELCENCGISRFDATSSGADSSSLSARQTNIHRKEESKRLYVIVGIITSFVMILFNFNCYRTHTHTYSADTYTSTRYPDLGQLVRLKGGYPFGATKELHEKLCNIIIAKDEDALIQLISTGLVGVTKEGDEAYYEGQEGEGWLPSGIVKVRFKGTTATYYTNSEAVGIK